jgi:hypothetical protein
MWRRVTEHFVLGVSRLRNGLILQGRHAQEETLVIFPLTYVNFELYNNFEKKKAPGFELRHLQGYY